MNEIINIFKQALMITGFVFTMMLIIEYINVQTQGLWQRNISKSIWKQYLLAALLGAIPGCLGAFTAVALFTHRLISLGALVTAMIATSGDEAFVMLSMFPQKAIILTLIIVAIGIIAGFITDKLQFAKSFKSILPANGFPLHKEEKCRCLPQNNLFENMRTPSIQRILLIVIVSIFLLGTVIGEIGPQVWNWIKITILITSFLSLFIIVTVPEHFLKEHLWNHIVRVHIPRIFLWIFGTLIVIHILMQFIDFQSWIEGNLYLVLLIALVVGIIPESGPHLIFITLFASGTIPFSILLASSIVQDGHGMLPLLAESKRGFFTVKVINIIFGAIVGIIGLVLGF